MREASERQRMRTTPRLGESHHKAKLTEDSIRRIRSEVANGPRGTAARLAREYGVARQTIGRIIRGQGWQHID